MIKIEDTIITPTMFSDKTSQVWKLPTDLLDQIYKDNFATIAWYFENESELLHLAQLKTLIDTYVDNVHLKLPYVPFARQDKQVSNGATFALRSFTQLLNSLKFDMVHVLDFHNKSRIHWIENVEEMKLSIFINNAIDAAKPDILLYPDAGAMSRYSHQFNLKYVSATKDRDQLTGYIKNVQIEGKVKGKKLLIIDDIADGSATFILLAKEALKQGAKEVHLYVTHGIFSKGTEIVFAAGISRIFTHKGEVTMPKIKETTR